MGQLDVFIQKPNENSREGQFVGDCCVLAMEACLSAPKASGSHPGYASRTAAVKQCGSGILDCQSV